MRRLVYGGATSRKALTKKRWIWLSLKLTISQNKGLTRVANRKMVTRDEMIRQAIDEFLEREKK